MTTITQEEMPKNPNNGDVWISSEARRVWTNGTWRRVSDKFSHYFRPCPYEAIDIYRVLDLFEVTCPARQHAIKKLMCAGSRGDKDLRQDIEEAVATLKRKLDMMDEDRNV